MCIQRDYYLYLLILTSLFSYNWDKVCTTLDEPNIELKPAGNKGIVLKCNIHINHTLNVMMKTIVHNIYTIIHWDFYYRRYVFIGLVCVKM